jgi:hypothetical protein
MKILSSRCFVLFLAVGVVAGCLTNGFAAPEKIEFPAASQHGWVKQRVGLTDIEIDYSRPNKNGRVIFGGLLPFDKVWRTGANASTKIKFSDAVGVGGKPVAAGEYSLYTIPSESEWTIIVSKDTKGFGAYDYKSDSDAVRVTARPEKLAVPVETFTIGFSDLKDDRATLFLEWDTVRVSTVLTTNTFDKLNSQIEAALKNPDSLEPRFYYDAASFYYAHETNLEQAQKWIDVAIAKKPDLYSFYFRKAQIEAKLGHKTEAAAAAQKSIELLKSAKTVDEAAVRNSQMLIDSLGRPDAKK